MAKTKISEYDSTANNNTDVASVNIDEGCAPSGINNAIRAVMAHLKDFQQGTNGDSFNGPHNGTVGATTPAAGTFTTLATTGNTTLGNDSGDVITINGTTTFNQSVSISSGSFNGAIGSTTPSTGAFTTLAASGAVTLSGGTANGVAYLNGSKVLTTGSALTFDGTNLGLGTASVGSIGTGSPTFQLSGTSGSFPLRSGGTAFITQDGTSGKHYDYFDSGVMWHQTTTNTPQAWTINNSEQMRLTSTGLGIGTSSPGQKLQVEGIASFGYINSTGQGTSGLYLAGNSGSASLTQFGGELRFNTGGTANTAGTSSTERMRLDSSGNLGLGVTPSAWGGAFKALQVGAVGSTYVSSAGDVLFGRNTYNNGTNSLYLTSNFASAYGMINGQHQWFTAPSGTAGNAISFTQAMTLDAGGRLLVGQTSGFGPISAQANTAGYSFVSTNDPTLNYSQIYFAQSTSGAYTFIRGDGRNSGYLAFGTNDAERARIDSSGNLLVGTTSVYGKVSSAQSGAGGYCFGTSAANNSGTYYHMQFTEGGTLRGQITSNGTSTTYATSSDYRLKENIKPMQNALSVVEQLNPVTYTWKVNGSDGQGFIAHELQAVVPDCVTGEKDAVDADGNPVYQGIDTSFLVATLTAAIQELKAEVDSLKSEINTLKGI